MQIFRTFGQETESQDFRQLPGYAELSEQARASVETAYNAVFASRQHLGMKIAQGIALESAKQALQEAKCRECGREMKEVRLNGGTHKYCPICHPKSLGYGQTQRRMKEDDSEENKAVKDSDSPDDLPAQAEKPKPPSDDAQIDENAVADALRTA